MNKAIVKKNYEVVIPSLKEYSKVEFEDTDEGILRVVPKH